MRTLYNLSARLIQKILPVTGLVNDKMKKFVDGRKETFSVLEEEIDGDDRVIWFHVASLGEYEQGLPIIETVREFFPTHKILISFFSPSGYENKKNTAFADAVVYLPLDTPSNVSRFLDLTHPDLVFFVKYDLWPNYLKELKERNIHTILISGGFRKDQVYFKSYGKWMRNSLKTFDHIFVQNERSKDLLNSIGFQNVTVSGDTRYDRVARQVQQDNKISFIEEFLDNEVCIVAGSTWPEDDFFLQEFINEAPSTVKFIIAPHEIKPEKIKKLRNRFSKKTLVYTERQNAKLKNFQVLILDTVGLLSKVYSYADIAYVGGAAGKSGLHNILEPATFGVPIVTGSNFSNFPEAKELQKIAGLYAVKDPEELKTIFSKFLNDKDFRIKTGMIAGQFIRSNVGATQIVRDFLKKSVKIP